MIKYPTIYTWFFMGAFAGAGFFVGRGWAMTKSAFRATFGFVTQWAEYLLDIRRLPLYQFCLIT